VIWPHSGSPKLPLSEARFPITIGDPDAADEPAAGAEVAAPPPPADVAAAPPADEEPDELHAASTVRSTARTAPAPVLANRRSPPTIDL